MGSTQFGLINAVVVALTTAIVTVSRTNAQCCAERPTLTIQPCNPAVHGIDCEEASLDVLKYLPSLDVSCIGALDKDSLYFCPTGLWIFYDGENFTGDARIHNPASSPCAFLGTRVPRSFRFPGNTYNISAPTLTVYETTYFHGDEYKLYDSEEDFRFPFDSFVLITTDVKLWTGRSFSGDHICVPSYGGGGGAIRHQWSVNATRDYSGLLPGSIRSIEFVDSCR